MATHEGLAGREPRYLTDSYSDINELLRAAKDAGLTLDQPYVGGGYDPHHDPVMNWFRFRFGDLEVTPHEPVEKTTYRVGGNILKNKAISKGRSAEPFSASLFQVPGYHETTDVAVWSASYSDPARPGGTIYDGGFLYNIWRVKPDQASYRIKAKTTEVASEGERE